MKPVPPISFRTLLEERRESGWALIKSKWKLRHDRHDGVTTQLWTDWLKKNFPAGYANAVKNMNVARQWLRVLKAVNDGEVTNFTELDKFLTKKPRTDRKLCDYGDHHDAVQGL